MTLMTCWDDGGGGMVFVVGLGGIAVWIIGDVVEVIGMVGIVGVKWIGGGVRRVVLEGIGDGV